MAGAHRRSRRLTRPCPGAVLSGKGTPKKTLAFGWNMAGTHIERLISQTVTSDDHCWNSVLGKSFFAQHSQSLGLFHGLLALAQIRIYEGFHSLSKACMFYVV